MNLEIPEYPNLPKKKEDPVERSLSRADACAKPATMAGNKVRVRTMAGDKSLKRKRRKRDKRDVTFY